MAVSSTSNTTSNASALAGSGTLSSLGIGSGLDVTGIVSKLMGIERKPIDQIDTKTGILQAELTAYGTLMGSLSSFQSAAQALKSTSTFSGTKATVADTTQFTATSASGAAIGNYSIQVNQIAQSQKLQSAGFNNVTDSLGNGSLTFDFGTYSTDSTTGATNFVPNTNKKSITVTIPSGGDSLNGIATAINNSNAGLSATVINDGSKYYLSFSPIDGGSANSLRVTVNDSDGKNTDATGLSRLAFDKSSGYSVSTKVYDSATSVVIDGAGSSNNQFSISLNGGATVTATLADGTYTSSTIVAAVQTAVDGALGAGKAKVSLDASNKLMITATTTAGSSEATEVTGNTGLALIGGPKLSAASIAISAAAKNNQFSVSLDGGASATVTIPDGTYDATNIVSTVQSAINSALGSGKATVALSGNQLTVTSVASGAAAKFSGVSGNNGLSLVRGLTFTNPGGSVANVAISAVAGNNQFKFRVDDNTPQTLTIADGTYDATSIVGAFQAAADSALGAGKAVVTLNSSNQIVINAAASATSSVTVGSTTNNTGLITLFGSQTGSVTGTQNLTEKVPPVDAKITVDGILITKSSNVITDAIQGVTLSLLQKATTSTSLTVTRDNAGVSTAVSGLVKAYNDTSKMLADLLAYDPNTGKAGALQSEGTVRSVQAQIRSALQSVTRGGGISTLSEIGITFQRDGKLAFDSTKLNSALSSTTKDVGAFFIGADGSGKGIASSLDSLLNKMLGGGGTLSARTDGLNQTLSTFATRRATLETRMTVIEARYRKQYSALDVLISSMNQTSTSLTQQLANLPGLVSNSSNK